MKKIITLIAVVCVYTFVCKVGTTAYAQDIHFSQFYMSPLNQNPAMAGAIYGMEATLNYKEQWRSVSSPYKTIAASYNLSLQKKKRTKAFYAAGINFFSDKAGDSKMGTTQANVTGAAQVYINRYSKFGGGIQVGFAQRSIDYSALTWGNQFDGLQYDGSLGSKENLPAGASAMYPDVSAGVVYTYNNTAGMKRVVDNNDFRVTVGASVFHISRPNFSFMGNQDQLYAKFVLHGNGLLSIPYTNVGFAPGFFAYKQGPAAEVYMGSLVRYVFNQRSRYTGNKTTSSVSVGSYYRNKDAAVIAFLIEHSNYSIGMTYDVNISNLRVASIGRGGFEIALRYNAGNPFVTTTRSRF